MPTMCSSTMGLVDPLGWPPAVVAGTHTAAYISSSIRAPEKAAGRIATPRMSATPMPRSPIMNGAPGSPDSHRAVPGPHFPS